jgi:hypothetical protein
VNSNITNNSILNLFMPHCSFSHALMCSIRTPCYQTSVEAHWQNSYSPKSKLGNSRFFNL